MIRRPSSFAARSRAAISVPVNSRGNASGAGRRAFSAASRGGVAACGLPPTTSGHQRSPVGAADAGSRREKNSTSYTARNPSAIAAPRLMPASRA